MCAIVVSWKSGASLRRCLRSIEEQSAAVEVVVVDNSPGDGSCRRLAAEWPKVRVVSSGLNLGYAGGANLGARQTAADVLLFLNPDVILRPGCVAALCGSFANGVGIAGPVIEVGAAGGVEYGATLNRLGMPTALGAPRRPPLYVSGAALATPRRVFELVGGFDGRYFMFVEDVEYCWRVLLTGLDVVVNGSARAWHQGGGVAAGGYPVAGRPYTTSALRVTYRERNTLAAFLACAPARWLPMVVPALVGRSLAIAAASVILRRPGIAISLLRGLGWNAMNIRQTMERRRSLVRSREGRAAAVERMSREPLLLRAVVRHWPPRIVGDHRP